jgi:hypothetical protein
MAYAIKNGAGAIMPGFGTQGNDGGSSVSVTGTAQPSTDNTAATTSTAVSAGTANKGYVRIAITSVDASVKIASILVTVTDGSTTRSIGGFNPASADQTNGQNVDLVIPWVSDLAVNKASAKITPSGSKAGSIEYQCDIELVGNVGVPATGTGTL